MNQELYTPYVFPAPSGKLLSTQTFPNGNMVNYTSQLIFLASHSSEILSSEDLICFWRGLSQCGAYGSTISRYPNTKENTSVDDYLAAACNEVVAARMLSIARWHFGFLDLNYPKVSFSQFMFRFQGFWQHMKISARAFVGPLGRLIWAINLVIAAQKPFSFQDNWIESHLMVLVKERRNFWCPICDLAIRYWRKKKTKTTADIMASYIGTAEHPLVYAWRKYA